MFGLKNLLDKKNISPWCLEEGYIYISYLGGATGRGALMGRASPLHTII